MTDLFDAPNPPRLAVVGTEAQMPINRIFCVGRNYAKHAAELGNEVQRDAPFYFTKSHHAVVKSGDTAPYAPGTVDYHHEIELVVAIGKGGFRIIAADAMAHVLGFCVGLDMTRRDLQQSNRTRGLPWDTAKDVEGSCILAPLTRNFSPDGQRIHLNINGQIRQDASLSELIWSLPEIIAHLSTLYTLQPGDLIMTGTPAGVSAVRPGDVLEGGIEGLAPLNTTIGQAP